MNSNHNITQESELLTQLIISEVNSAVNSGATFSLAISGGNSPVRLFELWTTKYANAIEWEKIALYWVDERSVPPDHPESNYGNAKRLLLDKVPLLNDNIFRIFGENDAKEEAERYSKQALINLPHVSGFPVFDMVILGVGDDGHTSSIFPGQQDLLTSDKPFAPSVNPYSGQKRVAMTGNTVKYAKRPLYFINGISKSDAVEKLLIMKDNPEYPAAWLTRYMREPFIFWDR